MFGGVGKQTLSESWAWEASRLSTIVEGEGGVRRREGGRNCIKQWSYQKEYRRVTVDVAWVKNIVETWIGGH